MKLSRSFMESPGFQGPQRRMMAKSKRTWGHLRDISKSIAQHNIPPPLLILLNEATATQFQDNIEASPPLLWVTTRHIFMFLANFLTA